MGKFHLRIAKPEQQDVVAPHYAETILFTILDSFWLGIGSSYYKIMFPVGTSDSNIFPNNFF